MLVGEPLTLNTVTTSWRPRIERSTTPVQLRIGRRAGVDPQGSRGRQRRSGLVGQSRGRSRRHGGGCGHRSGRITSGHVGE